MSDFTSFLDAFLPSRRQFWTGVAVVVTALVGVGVLGGLAISSAFNKEASKCPAGTTPGVAYDGAANNAPAKITPCLDAQGKPTSSFLVHT